MIPALASSLNSAILSSVMSSPEWGISQKLDGIRLLLNKSGENVSGHNRVFETRSIPTHIKEQFVKFPGDWLFDGELVGDTYYIFDCLKYPAGSLLGNPYSQRNELARRVFGAGTWENMVHLPVYVENKADIFEQFRGANVEGVIFKHLDIPYRQGRTKSQYKYKFTHSIDCVIMAQSVTGKDNFVLGVYDNGTLTDCGKVSALTGDGPSAKVGDVVEVTCLYVTDDNRLYQPVTPKLRTDKYPEECTIDQLETARPNKTILGVAGDI